MKTKKAYFYSLYLTNNLLDYKQYLIKINFDKPIGYSEYFTLTKFVASTLLNFQVASFLDTTSMDAVFLENENNFNNNSTHPQVWYFVDTIQTSFEDFKNFLRMFKIKVVRRHRVLTGYFNKKQENLQKLEHIERQANSDKRHITGSVRQQKSNYNRRINIIEMNYRQSKETFTNAAQTIVFFYELLAVRWHLIQFYKIFCTTMRPDTTLDLSKIDLEIWTGLDTHSEESHTSSNSSLISLTKF